MNRLSAPAAALVAVLAFAGAATAQTTAAPLTREAVIAELTAARASGELAVFQGEKGVDAPVPAAARAAAVATTRLPRQAVLTLKPTELRTDVKTAAALAADHGENAARELGDFPAAIARPASALAKR